MELVNLLSEFDNSVSMTDFLTLRLVEFEPDESQTEVARQLTYQIKMKANSLLDTEQRLKAPELADTLINLSEILPARLVRTRSLALARGLTVRANLLRRNGGYVRAEEHYRQAIGLYAENDCRVEAVRCQMNLFNVVDNQGRHAEASLLAEETVARAEAYGEPSLLADALSGVAAMHFESGSYQTAAGFYQRMLDILLKAGESGQAALNVAYRGLAQCYNDLSRFDEAIQIAEKGRAISQALGQGIAVAQADQIIANSHYLLGHYTRALRAWDEALNVYQSLNCQRDAYWVNNWRVLCLLMLNRLDEALRLCQSLISEAHEQGWLHSQAVMLLDQARLQTLLHLYEPALDSYSASAAIFEELNMSNWLALVYVHQSELLLELEEYDEAETVMALAEQHSVQQTIPHRLAELRLNRAQLAQVHGDLPLAEDLINQAVELVRGFDVPMVNYRSAQLLGEIAEVRGQNEAALNYYSQAIEQIERLRGAVTLELRGDFLKDKMQPYEGVVVLALARADYDKAYDYIERAKSRALTEMLANNTQLEIKPRNPADAQLIETLHRLREEHSYYYNMLSQPVTIGLPQRSAALNTATSPEMEKARQELHSREKRIEEILLQLQIKNSAYAEDFSLLEVTSEPPQPYLDRQTVLVEYYIARDEVLALAISATETRAYRGLMKLEKLERVTQTLSLVLQYLPPEMARKQLAHTQAHLKSLYDALFAPLAEFAAQFQHLIIVPHGVLHYLPFHALYNGATQRYLVQDFEVSYLPAASQLKFYQARAAELRGSYSRTSMVMGYSGAGNLPHVTDEASAVAAILGGSAKLFLEEQATRQALHDLREVCQVIHLATHGQFRLDAPLFSFVELADSRILTADLFNVKLNAGLVTLSACESGLNAITGGDELQGLSRACLYAGAASLLLSLWKVEDCSTTFLMKDFYRRLMQPNTTKAAALRQAQLALLNGELGAGDYRHPYFWSPFFLIGEYGGI